ncbi:MAG TPA: hypothetical protein VF715_10970 [Thermoleophilaceae bacterium]|jgi:hypothetical protein
MSEARIDRKLRPIAAKAKDKLLEEFKDDHNVVGAGYGRRTAGEERTDEPAIVVYVLRKLTGSRTRLGGNLPKEIVQDGQRIAVDVVETGPINALAYNLRYPRPVKWGVSIGHELVTAGTLGAVGLYTRNGHWGVLSNNHVMAASNLANTFDPILQPGPADTGNRVLDVITWVECWVPIVFNDINADNRVDAAVSYEDPGGMLINECEGGWPVATSDTPAVGLLFAGGDTRTFFNPIRAVLERIAFQFFAGNPFVDPYVGMIIQKTGRTTEHTVGRITEVDVSVTVGYHDRGVARFNHQFSTTPMGLPGDSGSVALRGGDPAGIVDVSGPYTGIGLSCASLATAEEVLGIPITEDDPTIRRARDRYLRQTLVGRYLVELFYHNELRLQDRLKGTEVRRDDRLLAQAIYKRYAGDLKYTIANAEKRGSKVDSQHLVDLTVGVNALERYQSADEARAAQAMLEIARRAEGKNFREVLDMLNDRSTLRRVQQIMGRVESINTDFDFTDGGR